MIEYKEVIRGFAMIGSTVVDRVEDDGNIIQPERDDGHPWKELFAMFLGKQTILRTILDDRVIISKKRATSPEIFVAVANALIILRLMMMAGKTVLWPFVHLLLWMLHVINFSPNKSLGRTRLFIGSAEEIFERGMTESIDGILTNNTELSEKVKEQLRYIRRTLYKRDPSRLLNVRIEEDHPGGGH
ncbi:MAG: hypothetical protein N2316_12300 [Spirochaetes bacterium]|nr:hypothetical protein [Spirochaetota bacterium]